MGIIPGFALCEDICGRAERFFTQVYNHPVTQYIVSGLLFINYYAQQGYNYIYTIGREQYYKHVDDRFENLKLYDKEEHGEDISTLYYSNHKTNEYVTLKSNSMTFKDHSLDDNVTREFINSVIHHKNPILSAILSIKDNVTNKEYSLEVNKILEPFIFRGNTIYGNKQFLLYLIHAYYDNLQNNEVETEGCVALEDSGRYSDFSCSLTYITLDDKGVMTIPEMTTTEWTMELTDTNHIELDIKQKED